MPDNEAVRTRCFCLFVGVVSAFWISTCPYRALHYFSMTQSVRNPASVTRISSSLHQIQLLQTYSTGYVINLTKQRLQYILWSHLVSVAGSLTAAWQCVPLSVLCFLIRPGLNVYITVNQRPTCFLRVLNLHLSLITAVMSQAINQHLAELDKTLSIPNPFFINCDCLCCSAWQLGLIWLEMFSV